VPLEGGYRNLLTKRMPLHILRGCSVIIANMAFFTGVASLPIADATAIFFVAPLFITALSVPFLGEKVGFRRWAAVSVGLMGVIIIIRPGTDAFKWAALAPILAALAYATMQITARRLGVTEKASVMAFYIQLTFLCFCTLAGLTVGDGRLAEGLEDPSLLALLRAWRMPSTDDLLVMLGVGALSACGAYLISQGYRSVEATIAAPLRIHRHAHGRDVGGGRIRRASRQSRHRWHFVDRRQWPVLVLARKHPRNPSFCKGTNHQGAITGARSNGRVKRTIMPAHAMNTIPTNVVASGISPKKTYPQKPAKIKKA